ncbi:MAG: alpha/beta hydrolase [Terriglobia bacterium]|nr:MAG: alpha/beta hydrolase [Terriglobia bacterium]
MGPAQWRASYRYRSRGYPPHAICENPKVTSRTPELLRLPVAGLELAVWDWPGEGPPLVFAHGNGFHGRCWDQVIRHFPNRRCLAPEARGHGRSSKPEPPYHWTYFASDLVQVMEQLGITGAIGIGHAMGGHSVTATAAQRPATFSAMLLLDPTIWELGVYGTEPLNTFVVRHRRNRWSSPDAMFDSFKWRAPFSRWHNEVLRDYCNYGLLLQDGEYLMACPPLIEASAHECAKEMEANLHPQVPSISCPVTILRAGTSARRFFNPYPSPTDPQLASRLPRGRDMLLREQSHFIPMEVPDMVAEHICGIIEGK